MASEQLRKKWGTIFMGEREATVEQLDAMQEPMRREKLKQEQEADYMERVRARAAGRAREILGEAYAERLKVLEEARAEVAASRRETAAQCAALKAEAEALRKEAAAELARAQAEREAAVRVREAAHGEGFQTGMDQAGEELREFRAELGQSLGALLRAVAAQRTALAAAWREELAELTREAVAAGTGHVLREEHAELLRELVFRAVGLLENRATITVRVNPADEAAVSDMFAAAREHAPELVQWIVNGDERMEPGGLVAESGSGSVDCRREHFREMVDSILCHLTLPEREEEAEADAAVDTLVERETARMAEMAPPPEPAPQASPAPADAGEAPETVSEAAVPTPPMEDAAPEATPEAAQESPAPVPAAAPAPDGPAPEDEEIDLSLLPPDDIDMGAPEAAPAPSGDAAPHAAAGAPEPAAGETAATPPGAVTAPAEAGAPAGETDTDGLAWLPPLGDGDAEPVPPGAPQSPPAPPAARASAEKANPSIAELEEELFPLDAPEAAEPRTTASETAPETSERDEVLAHGGFLPGA